MPLRKKSPAAKQPIRRIPKRGGDKRTVDSINVALAVIGAPDDFGPWFAIQAGRLPADFEPDL